MIIGSGMLAQAFSTAYSYREDVCIYAAGVSNSNCTNANEFRRERLRLEEALANSMGVDAFVYFGTCSVTDPEAMNTPYVQHKLAMEEVVHGHPRYLVLRMPQVAGSTPNPHTLLNYLYARIARSESFNLWSKARRNIIDISDVVAIAAKLIGDPSLRKTTINIANTTSYLVSDIVRAMEQVIGKPAVFEVMERGSAYPIDTSVIEPLLKEAGVEFGSDYLLKVIEKYYGARGGQTIAAK